MPLPASFAQSGFIAGPQARTRRRLRNGKFLKPLMIGTEGDKDTGKTEFILSCPGPGQIVCLDRNFDGLYDNPRPPSTRRDDFAFHVIAAPAPTSATQPDYLKYYVEFRSKFYEALSNPDSITVAIDGDSDSWELQKLADFGKLANVWPQTRYGDTYAARRALINRAWDSGKIIIGTNKLRDEFKLVRDAQGNVVKEKDGSDKKEKTGNRERQGFPDQDYLWQVQLRHLYKPPGINSITKKATPPQWGICILKCKHNVELQGEELWGSDCNFISLVQLIYPDVPMEEWGL